MKRKRSLSPLTASWPGSSCCSLYFIQLKCCWGLSQLQEPQSEPGKPEQLMLNSNTFITFQLLRQGTEQGCCPGDAPIPPDAFPLCRLWHQTECYLQLINSIFDQEMHFHRADWGIVTSHNLPLRMWVSPGTGQTHPGISTCAARELQAFLTINIGNEDWVSNFPCR